MGGNPIQHIPRFEHTISIVMGFMLRKSLSCLQELSCLFMDLASILMSAVRFSSLQLSRHRQPSANHHHHYRRYHHPMSPMAVPT
ncbi:hypothetical protein ES288_A09G250100v1 [Gossypium darwinii]|nr:hypothetical protein ES288_A09G250100v1 [Gossypium darwinii]TYI12007.1 hypothetical protein ES332_A09G246100v1 [Gossypium tomentosum]